jgi:hypothetical protein
MSDNDTGGSEQTRVGHCKADETDVYVGRGQHGRHMLSVAKPGTRGWLGNPFSLGDHDRAESIERFRAAFERKLERDDKFREAVGDLSGQVLGCWCQQLDDDSPACHGEIIADHADRIARSVDTDTEQEADRDD